MPDYSPDTDPRSSNSLIRAYLASKGLPLNGENVRRALEANNANAGTIPGLVNSLPSTEAEDQAAMAAARSRHGIGGNSGGGRGAPTPPVPPSNQVAERDTSTAPGATGAGDGGDGAGFPWEAALAGGAGAALAPLLSRLRGSGASQTRVSGAPGEPGLDIGDISLSLNRPGLTGPVEAGGAQVNLGRQPRLLANAAEPSLGAGIVNGEPLSIGAPAPQLAAPQSVDTRPVANPNEAIQARGPAPPEVIPLPGQRVQPILTPEQFIAQNPATANVPAIEVAPTGARARKPRIPKLPRVPL